MVSSIDAYLESLETQGRLAQGRLSRASAYAYSARTKQRYDSTAIEAQSLVISQEYKQEYFSFLLKRREELRLELAVSDADTRVVEDPMGSLAPVSPIAKNIYTKFILAGLAFPGIILLLIVLFTSTIRGRKDVEDMLSMPFLGEVPGYDDRSEKKGIKGSLKKDLHKSGSKVVINNTSRNAISEAFRKSPTISFAEGSTFRRCPRSRLSKTVTVYPRSISRLTTTEPMYPLPPVTNIFIRRNYTIS